MKPFAFTLVLVALLVPFSSAQAQSFVQAINACKAIKQDNERLACYDAIDPLAPRSMPERMDKSIEQIVKEKKAEKSQIASTETPPVAPVVKQPKIEQKVEEREEFGLVKKRDEEELQKVTGVVSELSETVRGKRRIHLENGAIWQQVDSGYMKLKPGMSVYIEKGALGSFYLSYEGVNRRVKVKRIQ